jgi:hypothetical protein
MKNVRTLNIPLCQPIELVFLNMLNRETIDKLTENKSYCTVSK